MLPLSGDPCNTEQSMSVSQTDTVGIVGGWSMFACVPLRVALQRCNFSQSAPHPAFTRRRQPPCSWWSKASSTRRSARCCPISHLRNCSKASTPRASRSCGQPRTRSRCLEAFADFERGAHAGSMRPAKKRRLEPFFLSPRPAPLGERASTPEARSAGPILLTRLAAARRCAG
jgi:hypothetical protein